jgi:hypothetical protein
MQRKTHDWISKWEQDFENDYGYSYAPKDNDNVAKKELIKQKSIEKLKVMNKEKEEIIKQENEVIMPKIPEKTVTEIVKEMSEKQHQDQIKRYEKEFGRGGIAELMRPL